MTLHPAAEGSLLMPIIQQGVSSFPVSPNTRLCWSRVMSHADWNWIWGPAEVTAWLWRSRWSGSAERPFLRVGPDWAVSAAFGTCRHMMLDHNPHLSPCAVPLSPNPGVSRVESPINWCGETRHADDDNRKWSVPINQCAFWQVDLFIRNNRPIWTYFRDTLWDMRPEWSLVNAWPRGHGSVPNPLQTQVPNKVLQSL
jgi:hypothetical protein